MLWKGIREGERKLALFTISACVWSINLSNPRGEESRLCAPQSPARVALRSNRLFVLMSASSIAWTRSSQTLGRRNRWFVLTVIGGSGMAYSSPARLMYLRPPEMVAIQRWAMRILRYRTARIRTRCKKVSRGGGMIAGCHKGVCRRPRC